MPNPRLQPPHPKSPPKNYTQRKTKPDVTDQQWFGHCMPCHGKMEIRNPKKDQWKNGAKIVKGTCSGCGNNLSVIVPHAIWDQL